MKKAFSGRFCRLVKIDYRDAGTAELHMLVGIMSDSRHGGQILADKCTEYSGSCAVKDTYTIHADQYSVVDEISDRLQRFVSTHSADVDILFEIQFLFIHLVMRLAADKRAFSNSFRLLNGVATFKPVKFYGRLDTSESDSRVFTIDFHHLSDTGLPFDFYIVANCDRSDFRCG